MTQGKITASAAMLNVLKTWAVTQFTVSHQEHSAH